MKNTIKSLLRRDTMLLGILLGIALPVVSFGILYVISTVFAPAGKDYLIRLSNVVLVSVFSNLFTLRYYLLKLKLDKTGRGILLVTFVFAIGYFATYAYFWE